VSAAPESTPVQTAPTTAPPLALFPLHMVLFPGGMLPLRIFETRYVDMVRNCMRASAGFGVVLIRAGGEVGVAQAFEVGTAASIVDFNQLSDGFLGISCLGTQRFRIMSSNVQADGLNVASVEWLNAEPALPIPARHAPLAQLLKSVLPRLGDWYANMEMKLDDAAWVGHRLAEILPIPLAQKQFCLELDDPIERLDFLAPLLNETSATD
jgi:Lon protease-like protein